MCYRTVFALFLPLRAMSKYKHPGVIIRRGDLMEGLLCYESEWLIVGGAYIWRGSFSKFYGNLSLSQFSRKTMLEKSWETLLKFCQQDNFFLRFEPFEPFDLPVVALVVHWNKQSLESTRHVGLTPLLGRGARCSFVLCLQVPSGSDHTEACSQRVLCDKKYIGWQLSKYLKQCHLHLIKRHEPSWN